MKNLISVFAAMLTMIHVSVAQMPTHIIESMMQMEEEIQNIAEMDPTIEVVSSVPIRVINHKRSDQIFIKPEVVLSEATLNIIDEFGNPLMAYHFPKLSEIDLSIKRLPAGDYTLNLHSNEGSSSHKVVR